MTTVKVPIFNPVYKNVDKTVANDTNYRVMDGYLDEQGATNVRPGLLSAGVLTSTPLSAVDGLFWWDVGERIMAVSAGDIWNINENFNGSNLSSGGGVSVTPGVRPTFATDGTTLFFAGRSRIVQTNGTAATAFISDADAPTNVTHIAILDGYLIANNLGDDKFYWSELEDLTTWSATDFAQAGSDPDAINAFHVFRKELYFFGRKSVEIWQNDGQTPFSRVDGGFLETGCIAPYSIINTDNAIMWFSDKKRFVRYSGGGIEPVSSPYDKEIDSFTAFADCTADRINIVGRTFYKFNFPSQNRTLIYNETNDNWTEWGKYNPNSGEWENFLGATYVYSPVWNKHVIGSRENTGRFFYMSPDYLDDNGTKIKVSRTTGHVNYGTNNRKRSNALTIRLRRGVTTGDGEPLMMFRVKNDDNTWSNERLISLGKKGDYRNIVRLNRLGMFRTRQYEFSATDAMGVIFSDAEEDIYIHGN